MRIALCCVHSARSGGCKAAEASHVVGNFRGICDTEWTLSFQTVESHQLMG